MQILENTPQGSPAWLAARATRFCASEAAAALSVSKYTSRNALLKQKATGITEDVTPAKQRLFDAGHASEEAALPIAESIMGEDLFPAVGVLDFEGLPLLASFDGLTMLEDRIWENKMRNAALVGQVADRALEPHYWAQLEHQLLVSGAEKALFTTSDGTEAGTSFMWYESVPERRAQVIAAWKQFAIDLAAYVPAAQGATEKIAAEPVEALPAPMAQVTGQLTLKDNFKVFETAVRDFIEHRLIREPKTDQNFADLEVQIKAMKGARESLKANEAQMYAQVQPIEQAKKTTKMLDDLLQTNLSMAERILKGEKDRRKGEIVAGGVSALDAHIAALNKRLGRPFMPKVPVDFGGAIRGLKSLDSMEEKVDGALNQARLAANATADRIDANLKHLNAEASDYLALFPDLGALVLKEPQDFEAQVQFRVTEQRRREEQRAETERARIRQEETDRANREAAARAEIERKEREAAAAPAPAPEPAPAAAPASVVAAPVAAPTVYQMAARAQPASAPAAPGAGAGPATLLIGTINACLEYTVNAALLSKLGFEPARIDGSRRFYRDSDLLLIGRAIAEHTIRVTELEAAAA